ncbi:BTB/POZ domain-containing protein [Dorcoceras hygrometricum]|uniref:BTB/POZ domain-containing protein n=1 Tax=Dorcoceras hygrometricum TaxID=472368 RepID=A0A2Z7B170_9LAMI|nr:BTB/POZ domain-containing protein [Dorcoceras hygrometricum]
MSEIRLPRVDQGPTRIRNVPIAVTPEGFWCCPSPTVFQKTLKTQPPLNKPKSSLSPNGNISVEKKQTSATLKKSGSASRRTDLDTEEPSTQSSNGAVPNNIASVKNERAPRPKLDNVPRKVTIEFGEPGTSDLKLILLGKQGLAVKLSVHRSILLESSSYFANKISQQQPVFPCLEIDDCEDVEIYVETIGLMYCKELKPQLIKQSVSRVLRVLKIAEQLGYMSCIQSCLEYLEAVPWVGEDEEEKVVSLVSSLQVEGLGVGPVLKRVSPELPDTPKDTLSHIIDLVLKSSEERGRREMKSTVLKLLKEKQSLPTSSGSNHLCSETIYSSCKSCLHSLVSLFREAAQTEFGDKCLDTREPVVKSLVLESDNLLWLLDILASRQAADEFATMWSTQRELALLHTKLPTPIRHYVSSVTARLFVGIGRGELLPSKDTRVLLIQTWLQPLISDYKWLLHGCRSFDRTVVEEGLGRTILTLPLEDQQSILLSWLGSFLKSGDDCPNLQRAFEVWWRRTFTRPYAEFEILQQGSCDSLRTSTSKMGG